MDWMHWNRGRALAVGGLAAGAAAAFVAVLTALAAPGVQQAGASLTSRTTSFGSAGVTVRVLPTGTVCYTVTEGTGSSRSCRSRVAPSQIGYTRSPRGIGGVAGTNVRAVVVKLTRRGTVWATVRDDVFYADVPVRLPRARGHQGAARRVAHNLPRHRSRRLNAATAADSINERASNGKQPDELSFSDLEIDGTPGA